MGKAGRRCLDVLLAKARELWDPDFVVLNGENAAGGFGITKKIFDQFVGPMGVHAITMGNHWSDKREILDYVASERLVLPANMGNVTDEQWGLKIVADRHGTPVAVINLIGRVFMVGENRCPFRTVDRLLAQVPSSVKIRIIDIHAEATSEKQGMGCYLDGRVSLVYGTHSHVPSADERVLKNGTGFVTDLGMTGAYDSVIGIRSDAAVQRLLTGEKKRFEPAMDDPWFLAVVADLDPSTGRCSRIERIRWKLSDETDKKSEAIVTADDGSGTVASSDRQRIDV